MKQMLHIDSQLLSKFEKLFRLTVSIKETDVGYVLPSMQI